VQPTNSLWRTTTEHSPTGEARAACALAGFLPLLGGARQHGALQAGHLAQGARGVEGALRRGMICGCLARRAGSRSRGTAVDRLLAGSPWRARLHFQALKRSRSAARAVSLGGGGPDGGMGVTEPWGPASSFGCARRKPLPAGPVRRSGGFHQEARPARRWMRGRTSPA